MHKTRSLMQKSLNRTKQKFRSWRIQHCDKKRTGSFTQQTHRAGILLETWNPKDELLGTIQSEGRKEKKDGQERDLWDDG